MSRILIRLPNWLGDVVMSAGFCSRLREAFGQAQVHAIVRRELADIVRMIPSVDVIHPFGRSDSGSVVALRRFGRHIAAAGPFDTFFCLPPSFSSACMGFFCGARQRIGFRGQWRSWAFTRAYDRPRGLHRAQEYVYLLHDSLPTQDRTLDIVLSLDGEHGREPPLHADTHCVIGLNINSEAVSRRMSPSKGASIVDALVEAFDAAVVLIGAPQQAHSTAALAALVRHRDRCHDMAGRTDLTQLAHMLAKLDALVSVDSGPAHLGNAVGTPTVVLFGAGNESKTAPCNPAGLRVMRNEQLACLRCGRNICDTGDVACLEDIHPERVVEAVGQIIR